MLRIEAKGASPGLLWSTERRGQDPLANDWWEVLSRFCREWFLLGSRTSRPQDILAVRTLVAQSRKALKKRASEESSKKRKTRTIVDHVLESLAAEGWDMLKPHFLAFRSFS